MPPSLRKAVAAAIGGGAIAIASVLITGPSGNDGLEGVSYVPYKDIVGVWTVCHGHTGKDIMLGKTYTKAECKALLNKDLATVARQINPYIKVKWFTEFGHLNRGDMLTSEQHRCHNEKKKFQRRV